MVPVEDQEQVGTVTYCTSCGEELASGIERCPSCGESVRTRSSDNGFDWGTVLVEPPVSPLTYYGAAAGLVVGCLVYLMAATVFQLFVGVGIVLVSAGILHFDYHGLKPGVEWRFTAVIGVVWIYFAVIVMSAVSMLPSVFGVGPGGLPEFSGVLYKGNIGVPLLVGGVLLTVVVVGLRREQMREG